MSKPDPFINTLCFNGFKCRGNHCKAWNEGENDCEFIMVAREQHYASRGIVNIVPQKLVSESNTSPSTTKPIKAKKK